jgi:hypothetical protein
MAALLIPSAAVNAIAAAKPRSNVKPRSNIRFLL